MSIVSQQVVVASRLWLHSTDYLTTGTHFQQITRHFGHKVRSTEDIGLSEPVILLGKHCRRLFMNVTIHADTLEIFGLDYFVSYLCVSYTRCYWRICQRHPTHAAISSKFSTTYTILLVTVNMMSFERKMLIRKLRECKDVLPKDR